MIEQFHFLRPLWLLMLIPLAWLLWRYWRRQQQGGAWQAVCDPHLLAHLLVDSQGRATRTPLVLLGCAGLLTVLALAGPTWSKLPQPVYRNTAATVVLFNLSRSMNAPDVTPTRLERAKLKLQDFLRRQREGQTALIAYAGEAYVVSPLTDDAATIESLVTALQSNIMPVAGNNLTQALDKAENLLDQDGVYKGGRILLITDSAGSARARMRVAALHRKGRVLSVLAVGTAQGAPIKAAGGGFVQDAHGGILIPRLDRAALARLASAGHGHLVSLTATDADLNQLWPSAQASRINQRHPGHNQDADIWREQGPWLLLIVIPLLALAWRRGWLAMAVLAVMLHTHPAQASTWTKLWSRPDQRAYQALQHGDAKRAASLFKDRNWRSIAQYRAGNYAAAAAGFAGQHTPDALYNEANALAHLGKLRQAAQNYRKVLQQQPRNRDARHNLKIIEDLLKRQQHQSKANPKKHPGKGKQHGKSGQASSHDSHAGKHGQQQAQNRSAGQSGQPRAQQGKQQGQTGKSQQTGQSQSQPRAGAKSAHAGKKQSSARATQHSKTKPQTARRSAKTGAGQSTRQAHRHQTGKPATSSLAQQTTQQKESSQALHQWLRRIPDDPGGLLRRKFQYLHQQREQARNNNGN